MNWDDGTTNENWFPATHAYAANGVFTVRVTAYSDLNKSRTIAEPVRVTTVAPTCGTPRLSIALTDSNHLTISWSASAEEWVLETTNELPPVVPISGQDTIFGNSRNVERSRYGGRCRKKTLTPVA